MQNPKGYSPKPDDVKIVEDSEKQLKFGYREINWFGLFFLVAGIALIFGSSAAIFEPWQNFKDIGDPSVILPDELRAILIWLFIILALISFGASFLYLGLAGLLNRTLITADHHTLKIDTGLLPTKKNHQIEANRLLQFHVFESTHYRRGAEVRSCDLHVDFITGDQEALMIHLEPAHAWYIKENLERFYGLQSQMEHAKTDA